MPENRITSLELIDRNVRTSVDGMVVTRTFYLDPYQAYPLVLAALRGGVNESGDTLTRREPSYDSYHPFCFCTDAEVDQVAQSAMTGSKSLGINAGAHQAAWTADELRQQLNALSYDPEVPRGVPNLSSSGGTLSVTDNSLPGGVHKSNAGAIIRSEFRPLVFDLPDWSSSIGAGRFDFVDPQLHPLTKVASCGAGLKYNIQGLSLLSVGSEGFVTQPMAQFTIRRLMCPSVPFDTIAALKGKINSSVFTIGQYSFQPETLRFDDAQIVKRVVPCPVTDTNENGVEVFYDIVYTFTWNCIWSDYHRNDMGTFVTGYPGWNRIFGRPEIPGSSSAGGVGIALPTAGATGIETVEAPLSYYSVGWKHKMFTTEFRPLYLSEDDPVVEAAGVENGFKDLFH